MALIMILAICASTLGMTASAATYAADTVAVMSDGTATKEYSNLATAFAEYKGGETLTLVKDVTVTEPITIEGRSDTGVKKTLTIDGAGKTITCTLNADVFAFTLNHTDLEFKDLTVTSNYSCFDVAGQTSVVFTNTNILAGGTKIDEHFADDVDHTNPGTAIKQNNNNKGYVEVNGGVIKGTGTRITTTDTSKNPPESKTTYKSKDVIDVRYGRAVLNNPTVIGYFTEILFQVGEAAVPEGGEEALTAAGWINGGTYVLYSKDSNASNSVCVRAYRGALLTIFDGTFVVYNKANSYGSSVVGTHSSGGTHTYILGGKFYNMSERAKSVLIGHNAAKNNVANMEACMFLHMYGGEFYSTIVADRVEYNIDTETAVIRNKGEFTKTDKATVTVADPYKTKLNTDFNYWKFTAKYDATTPDPNAKIKVQNGDKVYYTNSLWKALNAFSADGAVVTLLSDITLDKECIMIARDADITLDLNGKKITVADGVSNAIRCQMGNLTIKNGSLVNNGGSVLNFGYAPIDFGDDFENVGFANYNVDVTLDGVAVTSNGAAYVIQCVNEGTLTFKGASTVNGAAPEAATVNIKGMADLTRPGEGDTGSDEEPTEEEPTTDAPATDAAPSDGATAQKGGCGNSIGVGAFAVMAVAGLACGIVSKKRED